jgi:phage baseplate assembly protein V
MTCIEELFAAVAELNRRLVNLARVGTVAEVDAAKATVRVAFGPLLTAPLPWLTHCANATVRTYTAPVVGEQVLVLSPNGNLSSGVAIPAIFQAAHANPASAPNVHTTVYADGTTLTYDSAAHLLCADVKGDARLKTTGDATGEIAGNAVLTVQGATQATFTGDVQAVCAANLIAQVTGTTTATLTGPATLTAASTVAVMAAGAVSLVAPAIALTGALSITGNINVTGAVTASADIVAGTSATPVSLLTHKHSGVTGGSGTTGTPVP